MIVNPVNQLLLGQLRKLVMIFIDCLLGTLQEESPSTFLEKKLATMRWDYIWRNYQLILLFDDWQYFNYPNCLNCSLHVRNAAACGIKIWKYMGPYTCINYQ